MGSNTTGVELKWATVHEIDTLCDARSRRLKHLLNLNHETYSILYNHGHFHNHTPHALASMYLLGGSADQLDTIWNDNVDRDMLESWKPSPSNITLENYRGYLSKTEYQRAWVVFFADQLAAPSHDGGWKDVAVDLLLDAGQRKDINSVPMLDCLTSGLAHPLIHLGYAFELDSQQLAAEALGLLATCYDASLTSLLAEAPPTSQEPTHDLFDLFSRVHHDENLPVFQHPGDQNLAAILRTSDHMNTMISYLNSWSPSDLTNSFHQLHRLAALLLISTSPDLNSHWYDFFLVHLLTSCYALRVVLPCLPAQHHASILRQWLLMALLVYTAQNRPRSDPTDITSFKLEQSHDWDYVRNQALNGDHATDAHFVKACRALTNGEETWGKDDGWWLKAAVRFVNEFEKWGGFAEGDDAERKRKERLKDGIHV